MRDPPRPIGPGRWADHAACKGRQDELILPDRTRNEYSGRHLAIHVANAKAICADCAVKVECLEWSCTFPDPAIGFVAGGLTDRERHHLTVRHAS